MKAVSGRFIADGSAINVNCGFIPDRVTLYRKLEETNPDKLDWFKDLADAGEDCQYGILLTGSTGVVTENASAAAGIAAYEGGKKVKVRIPAPDGDGYVNANVSDFALGGTQPSARSTSVVGSVYRPSTHNGLVYECTVSAGVLGTEPTWPTTPGETVSDGTNTFICRREITVLENAEGFTVGADLSTDGDDWVYEAAQYDKVTNHGDAAVADPI